MGKRGADVVGTTGVRSPQPKAHKATNSEEAASGAGECPASDLKTPFAATDSNCPCECPDSDLKPHCVADYFNGNYEQLFSFTNLECAEAAAAAAETAPEDAERAPWDNAE